MERLINQIDNNKQTLLSLLQSQQQTITSQHLEIQSQSERIEELERQLDWLQRQVFGRKSERMVIPGQAELFAPQELAQTPPQSVQTEAITYERRKPKRNRLPQDLPREHIELDVAEAEKVCPCCHGQHRRGDERRAGL